MSHDVEAIVAAAKQVVIDARRLGLIWTMQNATVTSTSPVQATMDGDNVSIQVTSMIGPLRLGLRVYIIQVPPAGNYVIGSITDINQSWTPMSLLNGWANSASPNISAKYRMLTFPPATAQIVGIINAGTITNGTAIATLPADFAPLGQIEFPITTFPTGFGTGISPSLQAATTGSLNVFGLPVGTTAISFNAMIPLDVS